MRHTIVDDFSVIIRAHTEDRFNSLIAAIESVKAQTHMPSEIIVVIDHNSKLFNRVREHIPDIIVVESTRIDRKSGAGNTGVSIAKGSLIAFLDDDAIAAPDWLEILSTAFTDTRVLGVGGAVLPSWLSKKPSWFPEEFYWAVGCTYRGMPRTAARIRNLILTSMALRREVFDTVGGFRTERCEETELCIRAQQHWPQGFFLYQPEARVSHLVPSNRGTWKYFSWRCYTEGLSKAIVSRCIGVKDSLSSESIYILRTLPLGVLRNLTDALFHRDPAGFLRAGAIIAGLMMTIVGYLKGCIARRALSPKDIWGDANTELQPPLHIHEDDTVQAY